MLGLDLDGLTEEFLVKSVILIIVLAVSHGEAVIPSAVMQLVERAWLVTLLSRETTPETNAVILWRALRTQNLIEILFWWCW